MKTPHHCSFFRRKTNLDTSAVNVATPCRSRTQEENKKKQLDSCDAHIHVHYYAAYYSSLVFKRSRMGTSSSFYTHLLPVNPGSHTTCTGKSNLSTYAPVEAGGISPNVNYIPSLNRTLQIIITGLQKQKSMGATTLNQSVGRSCSIVRKSSLRCCYFHTTGVDY